MVVRSLLLPPQGREAMLNQARLCWPEEACGLLAGAPGRVEFVYPLTNVAHSPTAFTIAPEEHFRAWKHAEAHGWELIGAFHSHPQGPPHPSPTDQRLATEPDWIHIIVTGDQLHAYTVSAAGYQPVELFET